LLAGAAWFFILPAALAPAQNLDESPLPPAVVGRVTEAWKHKGLGRYMETRCDPEPVRDWPGWEGLDLKRCTYNIGNGDATVLMLNPSREVLVKWVVAACVIGNPGATDQHLVACGDGLMNWIRGQSGSQFPAAGLVDEPGAYSFRDGLAVKIQVGTNKDWAKPITPQYQRAALDPRYPVLTYGSKARIASTQRAQFAKYERDYLHRTPSDTSGANYLTVIRRAYQDAWRRSREASSPETVGKYRNDLIAAYLFE
jgi:hypothetical protein